MSDLTSLLAGLQGASTFEHASTIVLQAVLDEAIRALRQSPRRQAGVILRGLVHLLPDEGYRGIVAVEAEGGSPEPPSGQRLLTSATAWRLAREHGVAVLVDVTAGTYTDIQGRCLVERPVDMEGTLSRPVLLERNVTHMLAVPLRVPGGAAIGMICVEARCPTAVGGRFEPWAVAADGVQRIALLAAPWLAGLPTSRPQVQPLDPLLPVIGQSMAPIVQTLGIFARFEETILLRGPTGTGKSFLARWCVERSNRKDRPFVVVSLHDRSTELREAALFGWKKGSFTGAVGDHEGFVAQAEGGTLFIDEIDKLPLDAQARLLRLLEARRYTPIGESRERQADIRFIVGTNADLERLVAEERFLQDLYYRINVLPVSVPPLSARRDEIGAWARAFASRQHQRYTRTGGACTLDPQAEAILHAAPWPGNLRQLNSVVHRAYAFASYGEHEVLPTDIVLMPTHVQRALALESQEGVESAVTVLERAAEVLIDAFETSGENGTTSVGARQEPPSPWKHAEALVGFTLHAAVSRWGIRKAFEHHGEGHLLSGGNHLKKMDMESRKIVALCEALDLPVPLRVAAWLAARRKET